MERLRGLLRRNDVPGVVAVLVTMIPFWIVGNGINFTDEPYQIICAKNYLSQPSAFLALWVNHFGEYFGGTEIGYRYFTVVVEIVTLLIPVGYVYFKHRNVIQCLWLYVLVGLVYFLKSSHIVGWDLVSNLFLMVTMVMWLNYVEHRKVVWLLCVAVAAAVLSCSRLPNVVVLGIVPVLIVLDGIVNRRGMVMSIRDIVMFLVVAVCTIWLLITLFYGGIGGYKAAFISNGIVNNHGLEVILSRYLYGGLACLKIAVLLSACIGGLYAVRKARWMVAIPVCSIVFAVVTFYVYRINNHYNFGLSHLLTAVLAISGAYLLYKHRKSSLFRADLGLVAVLLLFALIPISGSNTGLLKVFNLLPLVILLPVVMGCAGRTMKQFYVAMFCASMAVALANRLLNTYEDCGLLFCRHTVTVDKLARLRTSVERADFIECVYGKMVERRERGDKLLVSGPRSILFEYLLNLNQVYSRNIFHRWTDDADYVESTRAAVRKEAVSCVLIVGGIDGGRESEMQEMLGEEGFSREESTEGYEIWSRTVRCRG